ncbi:ArnT family glycosyltransferase [Rudanella lutea]|uniref:ArnT family glycosyltransferase n=1 Tax=Rudanella lutea TaxID=451374 RepID=UPI000381F7EA|nr:glycosyltransferase family 39 protein [Rudanella lutea]
MNYARSSAPALPDFFFNILVTVGIVLNALGLFSLIMEPDGALYATIAKTVAESGDFVNLIVEDRDWLDKPHFPFWVAAISYKIFGINSFAYKFPAFLFFLGSVWYTYQFALLAYSRLVAQISTLVMLTALHLVISNNDVRAEPYLTAQVIGAVFHFFRLYRSDRPLDLVLGALWTGMALMTKGPFVVVPIGAGLFIHIVLTGQWREFLQLRWYLAIVLSLLFCLPELYTLYLQFDLHPEKVVFGKTGNSGIRFFFWDSQFGRFFNTGPIKGSGEKTFFLHTTLWAFAPWALLLYAAVGRAVLRLIGRIPYLPEYVSLGSGLMTFLLFSLSGFQLPHYLNIVFPFYAVLTAHFLTTLRNNVTHRRWLRTIQIQYQLLLVIVGGLIWYFRPQPMAGAIIWAVLVTVVTAVLARGRWLTALVGWAVGSSVLALGFYNLFLYPQLMPYQAGGEAAFYINEHNTPEQPGGMRLAGMYVEDQYSFEFYLKQRAYYWRTKADLKAVADKEPVWILTSPTHLDTLRQDGWRVAPIDTFNFFHVTKLTGEFLNHQTRAQTLKPKVLAEVRSRP